MRAGRQAGFTYVAVLIVVATMGALSAVFGELTSHANQRDKEQELLFVGNQYREAIASYYRRTPGAVKRYPPSLEAMLEDGRYPNTIRHLRRLYRDPITGTTAWGIVQAPDGGVMGVYSLSEDAPIKSGGFAYRDLALEGATKYSEWRFVHTGG